MHSFRLIVVALLFAHAGVLLGQDSRVPTLDDFMGLQIITAAEISPDGRRVAFTTFENDFEENKDMTQLWVVSVDAGEPLQLTHGDDSVGEFEWSSDGQMLAFMRHGKLSFIRANGGEAVTPKIEAKDIGNLRFGPGARALYFTSGPKDKSLMEACEERYGSYNVVREDGGFKHIWKVDLGEDMGFGDEPEQLTQGRDYSVVEFALSPDGEHIAFSTWRSPHMADLLEGRVFMLAAAGGEAVLLDDSPGVKSNILWRPDGERITYSNGASFPEYADIVVTDSEGADPQTYAMADYNPNLVRFSEKGIVFSAGDRTTMNLYALDPANGNIAQLSSGESRTRGYTYSRDGAAHAYLSAAEQALTELVVVDGDGSRQLTAYSDQLADFEFATKELITWRSYDGLEIEGVLTKPAGFKPGKHYPIFVRTHGGPTGTDRPMLAGAPRGIYHPDVLAAEGEGALVLQTNYRGSANYGEAFQTSNHRNLGLGPARDIIAGVEMLIEQGLVDPQRVGCLGWSQGGHISAMLATYSNICTAAIMGAGISDWRTYYYNTDITQFTTEYFDATPLVDDEVYAKTSPVSYIANATTPVLIQHGENDQRVPIANGYQLRQLLLDKGIEARMIVYSDMGHGPSSPRTRRAISEHALAWFREHLFGEEPADFVHPVEPEPDQDDEAKD